MQNLDVISQEFYSYLIQNGVSASTVKNYKSDITHFSSWLTRSIKTWGVFAQNLTEAVPFLNTTTSYSYKTSLENAGVPIKTINRRLSSLRKLSEFLLKTKLLEFDFCAGVKNIQLIQEKPKTDKTESILLDFHQYLENEKISKNTIKNYLSDIKQFFNWVEKTNQLNN